MKKEVRSIGSSESNEVVDINANSPKIKQEYNEKETQSVIEGLLVYKENEENLIKDDGLDDDPDIDKVAYEEMCSIVGIINQQNIISLKNLLLAKQSQGSAYFEKNYFIKDGFFRIYNFLRNNTHLNDQFSCFFTFKEVLNALSQIPFFLEVLGVTKEQLNEDENQFTQTCDSMIEEQMKRKKTLKNRKVNQKRRLREIEKRKALGLQPLGEEETEQPLLGQKHSREEQFESTGLPKTTTDEEFKKRTKHMFDDDIDNDSSNII